jgi:hypothetical protein
MNFVDVQTEIIHTAEDLLPISKPVEEFVP